MLKKFSVFLIFLLFTVNCGFTPIYSNKDNNISIEKLNFTGDRTINNHLKTNLYRYKNKNSSNKILLDVETNYIKNPLSKDSTGAINKYELIALISITINPGNKKINYTQKKIMENMDNKLDERDYEISAKKTFANVITEKLIQRLLEF